MNPESISESISDEDQPLLGEASELMATGAGSMVSAVERLLFGELADPEVRRGIDANASKARRAVAAGATEASIYEAGRVPMTGGEVIFGDAPATILKVCVPGEAMSPLDLLQYQGAVPKALAAVQHDLNHGWHWLGEPPPPDPTPEDRIREAKAAGIRFPEVGDSVVVMVPAPKSYRGVILYPLRARVVAVVETKLGLPNLAFNPGYGESVANQRFMPTEIWMDLELEEDQPDKIDREWSPEQRRVDLAGYRPENIPGPINPVGPQKRSVSWAFHGNTPQVVAPDHLRLRLPDAPCDRCGDLIRPQSDSVGFYAADPKHHLNSGDIRDCFASLCRPCADLVGRFVFMSSPEPPFVRSPATDEIPSGSETVESSLATA